MNQGHDGQDSGPHRSAGRDVLIRRAVVDDATELDAIVAVAGRALRWDERAPNAELFRWKHLANPAGISPMWVAECDGRVVGVRTFMRWPLTRCGHRISAVRAVDTATDPDFQGMGLFRRLTSNALVEMEDEGVDFVFNTPNALSLPGYLAMGWEQLGHVPIAARPARPTSLMRMFGARVPAEKWSESVSVGVPVDALPDNVLELLGNGGDADISTDRSAAHLRWRYGFEPLCYRVLSLGGDPTEAFAVLRLRRRGRAMEATVCEVYAAKPRNRRPLFVGLVRALGADYMVMVARSRRDGLIPLGGRGPLLTWRKVACDYAAPSIADWDLSLGDVELL